MTEGIFGKRAYFTRIIFTEASLELGQVAGLDRGEFTQLLVIRIVHFSVFSVCEDELRKRFTQLFIRLFVNRVFQIQHLFGYLFFMKKIVYKKDGLGKCVVFAGIYREEPLLCDGAGRNIRQRYLARICVPEIYGSCHSYRPDQSIPAAGPDHGLRKDRGMICGHSRFQATFRLYHNGARSCADDKKYIL